MLKQLRIGRAKRTLAGKFLCKLIGDEKGAVMMEYVIIAVLVAAACVAAVLYFSKTINQMFISAAHGASGNSSKSATAVTAAKDISDAGSGSATSHHTSYEDKP